MGLIARPRFLRSRPGFILPCAVSLPARVALMRLSWDVRDRVRRTFPYTSMSSLARLNQQWTYAGLVVAFWTLVATIFIIANGLQAWVDPSPAATFSLRDVLLTLAGWYTWIPCSMVAWVLVRRFSIEQARDAASIAIHLVAAPAICMLASALFTGVRIIETHYFGGPPLPLSTGELLQATFLRSLGFDMFIYLTIFVGAHALAYYRRSQDYRIRTSQLETELAEARLKALRLQLQPHFLFNTFNTIAMLVREERTDDAVRSITMLSEFLRYVLDHSDAQEVPLEREVTFLKNYLAIENVRFPTSLRVQIDVPTPLHGAAVPMLILQPLVENAIRHGIEPSPARRGALVVRARRRDDRLCLEVHDNGVGLRQAQVEDGIGLSNTKDRLRRLYGSAQAITLDNRPHGGLSVIISLPFRDLRTSAPSPAPSRHGVPTRPTVAAPSSWAPDRPVAERS